LEVAALPRVEIGVLIGLGESKVLPDGRGAGVEREHHVDEAVPRRVVVDHRPDQVPVARRIGECVRHVQGEIVIRRRFGGRRGHAHDGGVVITRGRFEVILERRLLAGSQVVEPGESEVRSQEFVGRIVEAEVYLDVACIGRRVVHDLPDEMVESQDVGSRLRCREDLHGSRR
jgi:hypothetical protein